MSDAYQTIRLQRCGAVALLTLARPQRLNAIDKRMLGELQLSLDEVERDEEVRALVVTGAGGNFSSGFDLKEQMETRPSGVDAWREILDRDFSTIMRFWHLKKPTIAAVQGYCLAGGCELALSCDITIAAEDAVFGEPELKFGAGIVVMILPWLVGPKRAKEIILSGADRISAPEAARIGLINRVVPPDQLESSALALSRHIAVIDPHLVQRTKQARSRRWMPRSTSTSRSRAKAATTNASSWRLRDKTGCRRPSPGAMPALSGAKMDNLGSLLTETCKTFADARALDDTDRALTYRQLSEAASAVERALVSVGLTPDVSHLSLQDLSGSQ